jgi:hypothetical protein
MIWPLIKHKSIPNIKNITAQDHKTISADLRNYASSMPGQTKLISILGELKQERLFTQSIKTFEEMLLVFENNPPPHNLLVNTLMNTFESVLLEFIEQLELANPDIYDDDNKPDFPPPRKGHPPQTRFLANTDPRRKFLFDWLTTNSLLIKNSWKHKVLENFYLADYNNKSSKKLFQIMDFSNIKRGTSKLYLNRHAMDHGYLNDEAGTAENTLLLIVGLSSITEVLENSLQAYEKIHL